MSEGQSSHHGLFIEINDADWKFYQGGVYLCEVHLLRDSQGVLAVAARMPSVTARAESEETALGEIRNALIAAVRQDRQQSGEVHWSEPAPPPTGALVRHIAIDTN